MGQNNSSNPLRENLESLHNQMMKHAGADYDIATTTTLTYDQFLTYITQLNQMWGSVALHTSQWECYSCLGILKADHFEYDMKFWKIIM